MYDYIYENTRRIVYEGGAMFVPRCMKCGRIVKADETITVNGFDQLVHIPNAICSKCGRVEMIFEGFMGGEW